MATGNSSSKRKSSSSHKKKPSKSSSEVKKRSRKHKSKSKKLYHRDASLSYSDDGLRSKDSVSSSSSDSEVDYRRSRSRTRKEEKESNRKRLRRNSSSDDEDSRESPSPKKKRKLKRSGDRKSSAERRKSRSHKSSKKDKTAERKKSSHKKHGSNRSRREKSVDSLRSNSRSLSSPRAGNSSGGEREIVDSRGRYEVKKTKMSHGRENSRSRSRSRSCSSFSGHSQENRYRSEDKYSNENYRGRIRSVAVAVVNETDEVDGIDYLKEENEAEIIQAYDDCPSSRSTDSFDGDKKKNASGHAYGDFKKRSKEDPKMSEKAVAIDISERNESEMILRQKAFEKFEASTGIDVSGGNDLESVLRKKALEKFEASVLRKSPEADDLEVILRQKALENLRKFRGGLQADNKAVGDQIDKSENAANYVSNEDTFPNNLHREAVTVAESKETASQVTKSVTKLSVESKSATCSTKTGQTDKSDSVANRPYIEKVDVITRTSLPKEAGKVAGSKETVSRVAKTSIESKYATSKDNCQIPDKNQIKHESRDQPSTSHVVPGAGNSLFSQMVADKATQKNSESVELTIDKSKLNTSTSRTSIVSPSDHSIVNQTPIAQNSSATEVVQPQHIEDKKLDEIPGAADAVSSAHMAERSENCESGLHKASSCITPTTTSEKQESKEQFEQKTMSVRRGGEMVQVSYKVYIPNKPPALARRKLNR